MGEGNARVKLIASSCSNGRLFYLLFRSLGTPPPSGFGTQSYWRGTLNFVAGCLMVDLIASG